jgi:hypothetical protein
MIIHYSRSHRRRANYRNQGKKPMSLVFINVLTCLLDLVSVTTVNIDQSVGSLSAAR